MATTNRITFLKNLIVKLQIKQPWDLIIIAIIAILLTVPSFLIAHQNLVNLNWNYHLDRIILFVLIALVYFFILKIIRKITVISILLYVIILFVGSLINGYGFSSIYNDYQAMLYSMTDNPYPQDIIINKLLPFPNKSKVIRAIDYSNPKVRNYALAAVNKNFTNVKGYHDYFTLIQCFAVFKEINKNWHYVSDPKGEDYIASASESLKYLSGDCDDHSILMAACVRAIGGTPRLIHTDGHIYPEILIGTQKDLENINYLIKKELFPRESKGKPLNYHIDEHGQIWLNLDYTARYPGGPFLHEVILGALTLE